MSREDLLFGSLFDSCPETWDIVHFEEAIDFQEGPGIMAVDFHDTGVPLIRLSGVQRSTASLDGCNFLDPEKVAKKWNHFRLKCGDLLISTSATIGMVSEVGPDTEGSVAYTGLIRLRPRTDKVWPGFIKHFASSSFFIQQAEGMAAGSVLRHFGPSHLRQMAFPIPPLAEQKAIAAVLGKLDDKIELNRRMNSTLEAIARALFKSWFVDFDPVRAKIDGCKPIGLDETTASLFPDKFQDSKLGQIPRGWEIGTLGSILDVLETGRRPKGGVGSFTSGVPSVGAESINGIGVFDYSKTKYIPFEFYDKTSSGRIAHFDVLLYKDGGKPGEFRPRVGLFGHDFPFKTFCINEHVFRMRSVRTGQSFLFFTTSHQRVLDDFANTGGKAAIPGINQPDVKSTPIVLPPKEITDAFNARADILCDQILHNAKQSRTLALLRDTLRPKLLSGELIAANLQS